MAPTRFPIASCSMECGVVLFVLAYRNCSQPSAINNWTTLCLLMLFIPPPGVDCCVLRQISLRPWRRYCAGSTFLAAAEFSCYTPLYKTLSRNRYALPLCEENMSLLLLVDCCLTSNFAVN
eukprot:scaffold1949_cov54-Cyclotella_meneghiniana.AAC.6